MYFTEGKWIEYERMMKETPGFNRRNIKTVKERDCKNCIHFDNQSSQCGKDICVIFDNQQRNKQFIPRW